jgi:protein involved in ribonucleotide reduction
MPQVRNFIDELKSYTPSCSLNVYNPWKDFDGIYDIGQKAPQIRCNQLEDYLRIRVNQAKYIFVAEALGFRGGHFTGIAMTSERILLGHHENKKLVPSIVVSGQAYRTSNFKHAGIKKAYSKLGYSEPTATIIWESIINYKGNSTDIMLWNIFPFHPYGEDILTNRAPSGDELDEGLKYLSLLIDIVKDAEIITIGTKSDETLTDYGIPHKSVPHPANGGANQYRGQIVKLL